MLLETIRSFVIRSKKHKSLGGQIQPPPPSIQRASLKTDPEILTQSDNTHIEANSINIPDAEQLATTMLTPNFLPYAQNCVINNPTMTAHIINSGGAVLQLLAQKRIPGAEVDSSARDPPPKCHPDTRKNLRGRILSWVSDPRRRWRMLWVMGPMGVGKSAIAQTIAEELKTSARLGATLFFSRPNHRDDPEGVIPTLAYQLAVRCPEYKRIITQRLADDATILEKNRRSQFKELILEPFQILTTQRPYVIREPLLIILDGLDECNGKEAQCELVELISDHVRQVEEFPLLWLICSRPEWHLKGILSHPDFQVSCKREEIAVDDTEARQDVVRVLGASFRDIRRKYHDRLDTSWPPEGDILRISTAASGHFALASMIIKFVGDEYQANPRGQLSLCIRFLGGSGVPGAVNPLHALDLLYRRILSDVPDDILRTTMRILGLAILYPAPQVAAYVHASFLGLDQATFYRSLQQLHSVLYVPGVMDVHRNRLRFYHASFADYLGDPLRSRTFSINKPAVHYDVAVHSLKWQRLGTRLTEVKQGACSRAHPRVEWIHSDVGVDWITSRLKYYSSMVGWGACRRTSNENIPSLFTQLQQFDFGAMDAVPGDFGEFLLWLSKLGDQITLLDYGEAPADLGFQDDKTLRITYIAKDMEEYLSAFGWRREAVTPKKVKLQLRLGRIGDGRNIEVKLRSSIDFSEWASGRRVQKGHGSGRELKRIEGAGKQIVVNFGVMSEPADESMKENQVRNPSKSPNPSDGTSLGSPLIQVFSIQTY